jgi:hypothetical protein
LKTQVIIKDFKRSENLETYLKNKIEDCVSHFFPRHQNASLSVKAQEESHRTETRRPSFLCEVRLKLPQSKTFFHVKRTGANFHECVEQVAGALREIMRRKHKKTVAINSRRAQRWVNTGVA